MGSYAERTFQHFAQTYPKVTLEQIADASCIRISVLEAIAAIPTARNTVNYDALDYFFELIKLPVCSLPWRAMQEATVSQENLKHYVDFRENDTISFATDSATNYVVVYKNRDWIVVKRIGGLEPKVMSIIEFLQDGPCKKS